MASSSPLRALTTSPLPRLVALTGFALALLFARVYWTGSYAYLFLAWNLFLAWVPFAFAHGLTKAVRDGAKPKWLVLLGIPWLLFLPNAPYLVTDLMHLRHGHEASLWFDAVMLGTYAWAGLVLGVGSLRMVAGLVHDRAGVHVARGFVVVVALLSGYGIYLGRFSRLNSWDVAAHPMWAFREAASPLAHPLATLRAWNVTLVCAALFLVTYATMGSLYGARKPVPSSDEAE